jgi:molybdopterin-synthase adenylyltransferase
VVVGRDFRATQNLLYLTQAHSMTDDQLLRYSRHILLKPWDINAQERVARSHALVIGAGGLGSPVVLYLASAGVGTLTVVDNDTVELTNLQRQIAHTMAQIGQPKVISAAQAIHAINPEVKVNAVQERADGHTVGAWVAQADVVIDCSDNFATRHAINAACVQHARPLVSGAAVGFDGQLAVYDTRLSAMPCYACIFPPNVTPPDTPCATMGVFAPLVGIIGSLQAAEALKLLAQVGSTVAGRLQLLSSLTLQWTDIKTSRALDCSVCANRPLSTPNPRS